MVKERQNALKTWADADRTSEGSFPGCKSSGRVYCPLPACLPAWPQRRAGAPQSLGQPWASRDQQTVNRPESKLKRRQLACSFKGAETLSF